jgi:hypothetical protein
VSTCGQLRELTRLFLRQGSGLIQPNVDMPAGFADIRYERRLVPKDRSNSGKKSR